MSANEPLYMQMREYLLELIAQNKNVPHYKLPSENQLAIKFGASRISSKHAFDTLEEEGLIFRQRGRGTFIADGHRGVDLPPRRNLGDEEDAIALIVPFISTIFMSELIDGIQEELKAKGLHAVLFMTDNSQQREVKYLRMAQEQFKGILLFPGAYNKYHEEVLRLVLNRFPLVQIDRHLPGLDLSYVASDHCEGTYRAAQFLFDRGHQRIGFVGHLIDHASSVVERFKGFDQATRERDSAYPDYFKLNVADSLENFNAMFLDYMRRAQPTAIITPSHLHGPMLMRALKELGKDREVELMLYDNEFAIAHPFLGYRPFIIDQEPRKIGHAAAQLIYKLAYENGKPQNIQLPARIYQL